MKSQKKEDVKCLEQVYVFEYTHYFVEYTDKEEKFANKCKICLDEGNKEQIFLKWKTATWYPSGQKIWRHLYDNVRT